jgi:Pectate lyase superfamily protein
MQFTKNIIMFAAFICGVSVFAGKYINVKDYGAIGNGIKDDALSIQKAADQARDENKTLLIPSGKYLFKSDIIFSCDIECKGKFIKVLEWNKEKTKLHTGTFIKRFTPIKNPRLRFHSEKKSVMLDPKYFKGIKAGDNKLAHWENIPILRGKGKTVTLKKGAALAFFSSDFFTARRNNKCDSGYNRNDICTVSSSRGDVSPEFVFSFENKKQVSEWNSKSFYKRGSYCRKGGILYQAAFNSGPDSVYKHKFLGTVNIGAYSPTNDGFYKFKYRNGKKDKIRLWQKYQMTVEYFPPLKKLTVNGLNVETYLNSPSKEFCPVVDASSVYISRSNIVFNNMKISIEDKRLMPAMLCYVKKVCNVEFNNCKFSGATMPAMGYNLLLFNSADIRINNCISTNSRCGIGARHGKQVSVTGGKYGTIDDHYGYKWRVKNVTIEPTEIHVPGYRTPKADISKWSFKPGRAFAFGGGYFTAENCQIKNCARVFVGRSDSGDVFGEIILKNIKIDAKQDVSVFFHWMNSSFDFAHKVKLPELVAIDNISINPPYLIKLKFSTGKKYPYKKILVKNCKRLGKVNFSGSSILFKNSTFLKPNFSSMLKNPDYSFENCKFEKRPTGLPKVVYKKLNL